MTIEEYFSFSIAPFTSRRMFDADDVMIKEGESTQTLFFLEEGRAKIYLSHQNGRRTLIRFIEAPCFFGEMELLDAQKSANGVVAVTPCICAVIDTGVCRDKLLSDAKFLRYLCLLLSRKTAENSYNLSKNQSYPLENRLAKFILLTAVKGYYREKHTEAAEYLGVTYRHLLYVLADFKARGILEKSPQGLRITDEQQLKELAQYMQ